MSRWFRFYDGALDDPKVQALAPDLFKVWVNLLCVASRNDGLISAADLPFLLRLDQKKVDSSVAALVKAGLLDCNGDKHEPHNWAGRQFKADTSAERVARYRQRRKDSGLKVMADYTRFRATLIDRDGEACVYCSATDKLVVDHMDPISLGGTDHPDNLALACKPCNSGKAGRTPEMAGLKIVCTSASSALSRYRDSHGHVTVTLTAPETEADTEQRESARARAIRLADGWKASAADIAYAKAKGMPEEAIERDVSKFRNHYHGNGAERVDWSAAWRKWIDGTCEKGGYSPGSNVTVIGHIPSVAISTKDARWKPCAERWEHEHGSPPRPVPSAACPEGSKLFPADWPEAKSPAEAAA